MQVDIQVGLDTGRSTGRSCLPNFWLLKHCAHAQNPPPFGGGFFICVFIYSELAELFLFLVLFFLKRHTN